MIRNFPPPVRYKLKLTYEDMSEEGQSAADLYAFVDRLRRDWSRPRPAGLLMSLALCPSGPGFDGATKAVRWGAGAGAGRSRDGDDLASIFCWRWFIAA